MNEMMERIGGERDEGSLSRLWRHNEKHDCGAITAFLAERGDGERYAEVENAARALSLMAKLMVRGYRVTKLHGTYTDGDGGTSRATAFFVVDARDGGDLAADLRQLGAEFEQDAVLLAPRSAVQGNATACLIGTADRDTGWLGIGEKDEISKVEFVHGSPIAISRVNGRPFVFDEVGEAVRRPNSGLGWWTVHLMAEKPWMKLIETAATIGEGECELRKGNE